MHETPFMRVLRSQGRYWLRVLKDLLVRAFKGWHTRVAKYLVYLLFAGIIPVGLVSSAPTAQAAGTITFNANYTGAPIATTTQVVSGANATLDANTFTRPGYTFLGWSTTPSNWSVTNGAGSFATLIPDGQANYAVSADTTLYAQWSWDFANTSQITNLTSGVVTAPATRGVQTSGITANGSPALIQSNATGSGLYFNVTSPRNSACSASDLIHNAFDNNNQTRFCISNENPYTPDWQTSGIVFSYQAPVIANGIGLTSANDFATKDPTSWTLLGSNTSATGPWTTVRAHTYGATVPDASATRGADYPDVYFENTTGYKFYQFVVNDVSGNLYSTNSYQFAELKLLYNSGPVVSVTPVSIVAPVLTDSATPLSVGRIATLSRGTWSGTASSYSYSLMACASASLADCTTITGSSGGISSATRDVQIPRGALGKFVVAAVTAGTAPNATTAYSNFVGPYAETLLGGLPDSTIGVPESLTATLISGTVTLNWIKRSGVSSYRIDYQSRAIGTTTWLPANSTTLISSSVGDVNTYTHALPAGAFEYVYNIYGATANGDYSTTKSTSNVVSNYLATSAPQNLIATSGGVQAVTLTWDTPSALNGLAIAGYRIEYSTNSNYSSPVIASLNTGTPNTRTYTVTGLVTGTLYYFSVLAIGAKDGTLYSSSYARTAFSPTTLSNPVSNLAADAMNKRVDLTWLAPVVGSVGATGQSATGGPDGYCWICISGSFLAGAI